MKVMVPVLFISLFLSAGVLFPKDIYVSSGAKSGNGSKIAPYGTIEEAMNMGVYAGDVVHVTEGVYYGEGGSGKLLIKVNNLTLAGGYKKDFSERNPWKYPTVFVRGMGDGAIEEAKKRGHDKKWGLSYEFTKASYNGNSMIEGAGEHDSAVVDGFVLDGYTRQTYRSNGDLKTDIGPITTPLISFSRPGCKVRNCVIMNSGGPGVRMGAVGTKDKPETWPEVANCVIVNTLMSGIDFRVGNMDPKTAPDGGYALIKNNTIVFVWSWLGEGYGILIGRQTRLTIENNIIAFATDFGMNNGFGNDKAILTGNVFFNNMGGVYRYFAAESKVTVVEDDPTKFTGKQANKMYYLSAKSGNNITADPKLKVDPDFFDKFNNQIKSEGGGKVVWDEVNQWRSMMGLPLIGSAGTGNKNYAPVYEHEYMLLFSESVQAGAKSDQALVTAYASASAGGGEKSYTEIKAADMKDNLGKDVRMSIKLNTTEEKSGFYIDGIGKDTYICYRTSDMNNFIYVKKGSEELETLKDSIKDGIPVIVSGTLYDIKSAIKASGKFGFVVDLAELDE